ncbi:hypothetical protein ACOSP7_025022 [Xanthoceras sorbifolium]
MWRRKTRATPSTAWSVAAASFRGGPKSMGMVPGLHPLRFKDLPVYDFKNEDTLLQLTATVRNTGTSSAVVWNSMDCLEQSSLAQLQQQCQVSNFSIGLMQKVALTSSSSL